MKLTLWLLVVILSLGACNGEATVTTAISAAGTDLSGINLEVHQAPG